MGYRRDHNCQLTPMLGDVDGSYQCWCAAMGIVFPSVVPAGISDFSVVGRSEGARRDEVAM